MCRGWQEGDGEVREYPGMTRGPLHMDKCIAPILDALNAAGIRTTASCCGHGVRPGAIALEDGREFIIAPDYDTARIAEKALPLSQAPQAKACCVCRFAGHGSRCPCSCHAAREPIRLRDERLTPR